MDGTLQETPRTAHPPAPHDATDVGATPPTSGIELRGRRVVLATDESALAHAAARVAAGLADVRGARPVAVRILDPAAAPAPPPLPGMITAAADLFSDASRDGQVKVMRARLMAEVARAVDWPFHVRVGNPAARIVALAAEVDATLIVLGLRAHGRLDRLFQDETALHVFRLARQPVLAVAADAATLPQRVVVATDFGAASARLIAAAVAVSAADAHVTLLHARRPTGTWWDTDPGSRIVHRLGIAGAFAHLLDDPTVAVARAAGATVDTMVLDGMPAEQILGYARTEGVELVAVVPTWPRAVEHAGPGSVTEALARDGAVSMLVARWGPARVAIDTES